MRDVFTITPIDSVLLGEPVKFNHKLRRAATVLGKLSYSNWWSSEHSLRYLWELAISEWVMALFCWPATAFLASNVPPSAESHSVREPSILVVDEQWWQHVQRHRLGDGSVNWLGWLTNSAALCKSIICYWCKCMTASNTRLTPYMVYHCHIYI